MPWPIQLIFILSMIIWSTDGQTTGYNAVAPLYPPLITSTDGKNATGGLSVEILKEASKRAGVQLNIKIEPWVRAYKISSTTKDLFLFPIAKNSERKNLFEWLGPVSKHNYKLYRLRNGSSKKIQSLNSLGNGIIGVLKNDVIHAFLKKKNIGTLHFASDLEQLAKMLLSSRLDYIVTTPMALTTVLNQLQHSIDEIEELFPIDDIFDDPNSYVVLLKGSNPILIRKMKQAFASMESDGTWNKMIKAQN